MKRISRPTADPAAIFDACTSGVSDAALAARLTSARQELLLRFAEYEHRATAHNLFSFAACSWGNEAQVVLAAVSKKDLMDLYSNQMVAGGKLGRKQYDSLIMRAPLGKCPFCGFGQASTLDHFLPKARYPAFSVLSFNLVPSCTDCNTGKGSTVLTPQNQILHPYFEDAVVETVPWLFSEVIESTPATVRYFVQPPPEWPENLTRRVINHFNDLELARRFGIEAASELAGLSGLLEALGTSEARRTHLSTVSRVERKSRTNSWRAALYDALADSVWYQDFGFQNEGAIQNHSM